MSEIFFSYIFKEDIDRIFDCFSNIGVNSDIIFKKVMKNLKIMKGERIDRENTEFSFCWKNYYEIKMVVDKVIKEKFVKSLTFKSIHIDKVPIIIKLTFSFFWDSIEEKTVFINILEYYDEFFSELINNDYNENDKINICKNVENYLSKYLKGLDKNYSFMINTSVEEAWKYVSHPKLFYEVISKDLIYALKEGPISLKDPVELFTKDKEGNLIPLITFDVQSMMISSFYSEVTYISLKKNNFPSVKLTIQIRKIDTNKCFNMIYVKPLDLSISYERYCNVFKFWKKKATDFFHFFEKRGKKK